MLPDLPSLNTYGGVIRDFSAVVDPTTDEGAIYRNRYVADGAAMARTACQAIRCFVGGDGPFDPGAGFVHEAMWGTDPAYKPIITHSGTGIYDIAWPEEVKDALTDQDPAVGGGEMHTVNFRTTMAHAATTGNTFILARSVVTSPNTIRVFCYSGTALSDLDGDTITVWAW